MRINYKNRDEIEQQYRHDYRFKGYYYDYDNREIILTCVNLQNNREMSMVFHNVIFSELQSCEFWGGGNSIYYIWNEEITPQMKHLLEIQKKNKEIQEKNKEIYNVSLLMEDIQYLQVQIMLNSGDNLLVICEWIDCDENLDTKDNVL